jgi:predicted GNAT superfamily acetyltransferase
MTAPRSSDVRIASLTNLDQYERCVELQLAVWGYSDGDLVPRRMFLLAQHIGGQVLGAFVREAGEVDETIVGFALAWPGYRNGKPYLHSHMLAVLPEYRNLGLGRKLKLAQRDDALARGIELMEWTYDPLEIKNAHLNIARLGAISRRYETNFYGASSSPLQGGLPTDRLYAEWWLRSPRVINILNGEPQVIQTVERVAVPHNIYQWKQDPERRLQARTLQQENQIALEAAFNRGLAVIGYERSPNGDGCFLLGSPDDIESVQHIAAGSPVATATEHSSH